MRLDDAPVVLPAVSVPVLSKAIGVDPAQIECDGGLLQVQARVGRARPIAAPSVIGADSVSAQGHATISTAVATLALAAASGHHATAARDRQRDGAPP